MAMLIDKTRNVLFMDLLVVKLLNAILNKQGLIGKSTFQILVSFNYATCVSPEFSFIAF